MNQLPFWSVHQVGKMLTKEQKIWLKIHANYHSSQSLKMLVKLTTRLLNLELRACCRFNLKQLNDQLANVKNLLLKYSWNTLTLVTTTTLYLLLCYVTGSKVSDEGKKNGKETAPLRFSAQLRPQNRNHSERQLLLLSIRPAALIVTSCS